MIRLTRFLPGLIDCPQRIYFIFEKAKTRHNNYAIYRQQAELFHVDDTETNENLGRLYKFIELLKPIDKAIMILYLEGCKNKEISLVMGMTDSNISTRKERIKLKLKQYFETYKQQYNEI